jgi:hypothetical protein
VPTPSFKDKHKALMRSNEIMISSGIVQYEEKDEIHKEEKREAYAETVNIVCTCYENSESARQKSKSISI